MISKEQIHGIIVPIITPIDEDENIDHTLLRKQVNKVIDDGVHGILAFGSNSEFYMFDDEEMLDALDVIIDESAGRVPVYFGIGAIRTKQAIKLAVEGAKRDVAGISVLQPMFIQPTEAALYNHFKAIADAISDTNMLLYHNPGRCGYKMSIKLTVDLANNVDNIIGIKDSSGDITYVSELVRQTRDIGFRVLTGKDTVIFPGLCVGAVGSVCSTANMLGSLVNSIYDLYVDGKIEESREAQFKLNPIRISQDPASFPAATKDMSNLLGLEVGKSVLPTIATEGPTLESMKQELIKSGFLKE